MKAFLVEVQPPMHGESAEDVISKRRRMKVPQRTTLVALFTLFCFGVVSCSDSPTEADSSASCNYVVSFDDTSYADTGATAGFEIGERLGTATIPPCNDTGGHRTEPVESEAVYRVEGLDPAQAIAVQEGRSGKRLLAAWSNGTIAPAVQAFIAERNRYGSVLVSPDSGLDDGATVTVTVRGLDVDTDLVVGQCAPVNGNFACLPASIDEGTHVVTTTPTSANSDRGGLPRAPTTAVEGHESVTTFTMTVRNPLRDDLALFDAKGNPVTGASVPDQIACRGDDAADTTHTRQSCEI